MAVKDLHEEPFDNGTIAKLEIFEDYAEAWLPTFVMQSTPEIHIFDFFSGPGYDSNGVEGSPIRLLKIIEGQQGNIFAKKCKIVIHLNEFEPNKKSQPKFEILKKNCAEFLIKNSKFKFYLDVRLYNKKAEELFFELLPFIDKYPSLVYLDQNGVKFISKEYLEKLESLKTVDFLFYVSSSYFKRLGQTPEFKNILNIELHELEKEAYRNIHRLVLNKIKSRLPSQTDVKLFPFSIKKGSNIYGIIFGAKHYLAVSKFLDIAWKRNKINGEADFDIDKDQMKRQLSFFEDVKLTKIEKFQQDFETELLAGNLKTNKEVIEYTFGNGHIPIHATEVIKKLKNTKISYEGLTPGVTYENVFKKKLSVNYQIIKK